MEEERPGAQRRKAEEQGDSAGRRRRLGPPKGKRPRDKELAEEEEMEEVLARGDAAERIIDVISIVGPPWFDEYTGKELSAAD
eukprot:16441715-Heterocapsa_arctica.AAC.1